ncbi:hypothetical protein ACJ41O_010280 [Fusarium nematophilum]
MAFSNEPETRSPSKNGTIHIYIDHSNILIQGQRAYAKRHRRPFSRDEPWKIKIEGLKRILIEESGLPPASKGYQVEVNLYASTSSPMESPWKEFRSYGVKVHTFEKNTQREKRVDTQLVADSVACAVDAQHGNTPNEFIVVSGDEDIYSGVSTIANRGFNVHVWSWDNGLAKVYKELKQPNKINVNLLDDHLEKIIFTETGFRLDRWGIPPRSTVVLDLPPSEADFIDDCVAILPIPHWQRIERHDSGREDLIIVPRSQNSITGYYEMFNYCRVLFKPLKLVVQSYREYSQDIKNSKPREPKPMEKNGGGDDIAGKNEHDAKETDSSDHGFHLVSLRKKKDTLPKPQRRCCWGKHCARGLECQFGHTKEEQEIFGTGRYERAKKFKLCNPEHCPCNSAHSFEELYCPTCEKTGAHNMMHCPERTYIGRGWEG